jgi:hypothetical protein
MAEQNSWEVTELVILLYMHVLCKNIIQTMVSHFSLSLHYYNICHREILLSFCKYVSPQIVFRPFNGCLKKLIALTLICCIFSATLAYLWFIFTLYNFLLYIHVKQWNVRICMTYIKCTPLNIKISNSPKHYVFIFLNDLLQWQSIIIICEKYADCL